MNVGDLINELKKLPDNFPVIMADSQGDKYGRLDEIATIYFNISVMEVPDEEEEEAWPPIPAEIEKVCLLVPTFESRK